MLFRVMLVVAGIVLSTSTSFPDSIRSASSPVSVSGIRSSSVELSTELLAGLPVIEQDVTFQTSKGVSTEHYKGVLVWDLFEALGAFQGLEHNAELKKTFLVKASDGYEIAFSVGEIHPDFGNTPLMLVTEMGGKPTNGAWRFVVPGDKRGARAIHEIASIEMR